MSTSRRHIGRWDAPPTTLPWTPLSDVRHPLSSRHFRPCDSPSPPPPFLPVVARVHRQTALGGDWQNAALCVTRSHPRVSASHLITTRQLARTSDEHLQELTEFSLLTLLGFSPNSVVAFQFAWNRSIAGIVFHADVRFLHRGFCYLGHQLEVLKVSKVKLFPRVHQLLTL